jgi:hypothetical protein
VAVSVGSRVAVLAIVAAIVGSVGVAVSPPRIPPRKSPDPKIATAATPRQIMARIIIPPAAKGT